MSKVLAASVAEFVSPQCVGRRFLFGCNNHSAELSSRIAVDGFIDDYRAGSSFCGRPVIGGDQAPASATVVNCVLMARSWASKRRVEQLNVAQRLDYSDLLKYAPDVTPVPCFVRDTIDDRNEHLEKWQVLSRRLADADSTKVLADVINFRMSADLSFLADYSYRPEEQYFDPVCQFEVGEVFVDCGGFDGDTTEQFCRRFPRYKRVWLFEPAEANMAKAKARLAGFRDVVFVEKGVSNESGSLSFNASDGSSSAIASDGGSKILVTTIDEEIKEPISFIKMDLEGWELKALAGARQQIRDSHPKLAIAVYHHPSDFWKIPEFILGIRPDYRLYLRHYTEGWTETVMYFIPCRSGS